MISVYVDEAAAFDMLAILQIKASKSETDLENYNRFRANLYKELKSTAIIHHILRSDEYATMIDANQEVFTLIEEIDSERNPGLLASAVHKANMKRFYAKQFLQEKFFSDGLTERKTVR